MVVVGGVGRRDGDGPADGLDGLGVAAGLVRGHARQVPGVGMARLGVENAAIDGFGLGQLPALVMRKGNRHGFADRGQDQSSLGRHSHASAA